MTTLSDWLAGNDLPGSNLTPGTSSKDGTWPSDVTFGTIKSAIVELRDQFPIGLTPADWTPRLVVNDANGTNSWTPSTGANPTLGTGNAVKGRWWQFGKLVWAEADIIFGTSGAAAGTGAYRLSLPTPCTADANTYQKVIGFGHMYDDDAPGTFLGLGPANFKHFMLHNAPSVTTDVAGLVIGSNLQSSALTAGTYTLANHTDLRTLTENTGDGAALDANTGQTTISVVGGVTRVHANSGSGHQTWAFDDAYVGKRIFVADNAGHSGYGVVAAVNNAGTPSGGLGELDLTTNLGLTAVANGSFIIYAENARTDTSHVLGTVINDLKATFGQVISDNTSNANPWVWGNNDKIHATYIYEAA